MENVIVEALIGVVVASIHQQNLNYYTFLALFPLISISDKSTRPMFSILSTVICIAIAKK
jgi:riboflavin transporter FmnP